MECFRYTVNKPWAQLGSLERLRNIVNAGPLGRWRKSDYDQFAQAAIVVRPNGLAEIRLQSIAKHLAKTNEQESSCPLSYWHIAAWLADLICIYDDVDTDQAANQLLKIVSKTIKAMV